MQCLPFFGGPQVMACEHELPKKDLWVERELAIHGKLNQSRPVVPQLVRSADRGDCLERVEPQIGRRELLARRCQKTPNAFRSVTAVARNDGPRSRGLESGVLTSKRVTKYLDHEERVLLSNALGVSCKRREKAATIQAEHPWLCRHLGGARERWRRLTASRHR